MQLTASQVAYLSERWQEALSVRTEATQKTYFTITDRCLIYTKMDMSRPKIMEFLKTYSKNSIVTAFYAIKFFCESTNLPFDIKRKDIAPTGYKRQRPVLSDEEIKRMIKTTKELLGPLDKGYIALSTVYGLRRYEIHATNPADIDIRDMTLLVRPAKVKGEIRERIHLIPDELLDIMKDFKAVLEDIKKKPNITRLNSFFDYVCELSNVDLRPRLGFHSVRRALNSHLLVNEVNDLVVQNFLRWKDKSSSMGAHYLRDWKKVDEKVFSIHPFLKEWKDE